MPDKPRQTSPDVHNIVPTLRKYLVEHPLAGETFSLYGGSADTEEYFESVRELAARCQERVQDRLELLRLVEQTGKSRRRLKKLSQSVNHDGLPAFVVRVSREMLQQYTTAANAHLRSLSLGARFDSTLSAIEEQYHLWMLEIELANGIFGPEFRHAQTKIAFLPHCLRDWSRQCRSAVDGLDAVCRGCSKSCWVNAVSKLLRLQGITPYIWMNADLERLFKSVRAGDGGLGVLGIACVPELARGLRLCRKHGIPAVGLPLNANRCRRWMGEFFDNSVNLNRLAELVDAGSSSNSLTV
jgi:hypothetical protein